MKKDQKNTPKQPSVFGLLKPYKTLIALLIALSVAMNALTLWLPRLLSHGIDGFLHGISLNGIFWQFGIAGGVIFALTYVQGIVQTYASERVGRDVRNTLSEKIATQTFAEVQDSTPSKLLTYLTSDIDAIKNFVSQAVVVMVSSVLLIGGGGALLLSINLKLGFAVLCVLPIIGATFFIIFGKVRTLFTQAREVIDALNKVINESILGAALIRVLHAQAWEHKKFAQANAQARDVGVSILKLFSAMIPIVTFASNLAVLTILVLGGKFVIAGTMSLGEFASFNSYLVILIFPIFMLGFVSNIIAQAQASYGRISAVLNAPEKIDNGTCTKALQGEIVFDDVCLAFGEKQALKHVSFTIAPKSKVAIIGPTAAGKTQLLNVMIGLLQPTSGTVRYDNVPIDEYRKEQFYEQVGLVFQDSSMFNMSIRENIAFTAGIKDTALQKAIDTAELHDFIATLPQGLDTNVSERGANLSGGQKQRIMLARSLAINPKMLLLDDFTARVDAQTEKRILENVTKNYPDLTLVSVTQKIASVEEYDQIIVLMEGEVVATGTHAQLMRTSPEYAQMYQSQQSTNTL